MSDDIASKRPGRGSDQFIVRFPDGMRDRIAERAKASGRSINAEIIFRLEQTLKSDDFAHKTEESRELLNEAFVGFSKTIQEIIDTHKLLVERSKLSKEDYAEILKTAKARSAEVDHVARVRTALEKAMSTMPQSDARPDKSPERQLDLDVGSQPPYATEPAPRSRPTRSRRKIDLGERDK